MTRVAQKRLAALIFASGLVAACGGAAPASPIPPAASEPVATPQATAAATPALTAAPASPQGSLPPGVVEGGNAWATSTTGFSLGDFARFTCPPNGDEYAIWGTDVYTSDSSVCTAGVHAGLVTFASGGQLIIEMVAGQDAYVGSERNGVTSRDYTAWGLSFTFLGAAPPEGTTPPSSGSDYDALLAHIDSAIAPTCTEVDPAAAGALAVANCEPEDVILDADIVVDDVVYLSFANLADAEDTWLEKYDLLGAPTTSDCATGSCVTGLTPEGSLYGRFACGPDSVYGGTAVGWWYDNRLNHVGSTLLAEGTCTDVQNLMGAVITR